MKNSSLTVTSFHTFFGVLLFAALAVGCSGSGPSDAVTAADDAVTAADMDHSGHDHVAGDGHDHGDGAVNGGGDEHGTMSVVDAWNRSYGTAEAERAGTVENLNGLRATLVAELESVRGRLKDGSRSAEERKADSQRAGELAQGLERLDRSIKSISEANDVSWADMRDSNIKAAGEFRAWMTKYGLPS